MKLAITGASGFIGRQVVNALREEAGIELILAARQLEKLEGMPGRHVALDVMDTDHGDVFERLGRPDALLHLAWGELNDFRSMVHVTRELPAHLRFLNALLDQGLRDMTVAGTCLEYGLQEGALQESQPSQPVTAYGIAKDALYKSLQALQERNEFSLKWVRPFYMWGVGQNPKSFFSLLDAALERGDATFDMSGGEQVRDFLPVEDVGRRIVRVALQKAVDGAINIGSGQGRTLREMAEERIHARGSQLSLNLGVYPYVTYEPMRFWADTRKFETIR